MREKKITNKSKAYLLPLLAEFIKMDVKFINRIENVYIQDSDDKYNNCIYILHNFNYKDKDFTKIEHELMLNELFVNSYDIGNQVLYIFKFPNEYLYEFERFKESKYSKFGNDAKEMILEFWGHVYRRAPNAVKFLNRVKGVLFKETRLKKEIETKLSTKGHKVVLNDNAELGEFIDMKLETFDYNIIKNIEINEDNDRDSW